TQGTMRWPSSVSYMQSAPRTLFDKVLFLCSEMFEDMIVPFCFKSCWLPPRSRSRVKERVVADASTQTFEQHSIDCMQATKVEPSLTRSPVIPFTGPLRAQRRHHLAVIAIENFVRGLSFAAIHQAAKPVGVERDGRVESPIWIIMTHRAFSLEKRT